MRIVCHGLRLVWRGNHIFVNVHRSVQVERHHISRQLHDLLKMVGIQIDYPPARGRNLEDARLVLVDHLPFSQSAAHDGAVN